MATIGKQMRKYNKDQFSRMVEGNLVNEAETAQFANKAREATQASVQAQTAVTNRAAAANAAGSPVVAGALKDSSKQIAKAGADAAIKATGQANQFSEAVREQRRAATMQNAVNQRSQNREDIAMAIDGATAMTSMGSEMGLF